MNADDTLIFLTFGRISDPSAALAEEGRLVAEKGGGLGRQVALIGAETDAFRLNSPGWIAVPPEVAGAMKSRVLLRTLCRDRLVAALPPFAANAKRVVEAYLDRIGELAGQPPGQMKGLTDPTDRYFAALLPMAHAHIQPVTIEADRAVPVPDLDAVRADLAFWDGRVLTAILFGGPETRLPRQVRALSVLSERFAPKLRIIDTGKLPEARPYEAVPDEVFAEMKTAEDPVYGPYRAPGFAADLPDTI